MPVTEPLFSFDVEFCAQPPTVCSSPDAHLISGVVARICFSGVRLCVFDTSTCVLKAAIFYKKVTIWVLGGYSCRLGVCSWLGNALLLNRRQHNPG
jgi:hypothetical protein